MSPSPGLKAILSPGTGRSHHTSLTLSNTVQCFQVHFNLLKIQQYLILNALRSISPLSIQDRYTILMILLFLMSYSIATAIPYPHFHLQFYYSYSSTCLWLAWRDYMSFFFYLLEETVTIEELAEKTKLQSSVFFFFFNFSQHLS